MLLGRWARQTAFHHRTRKPPEPAPSKTSDTLTMALADSPFALPTFVPASLAAELTENRPAIEMNPITTAMTGLIASLPLVAVTVSTPPKAKIAKVVRN